MKMTNKKIVTVLLLFFVFMALISTVTFAWLSIGEDNNVDLNLGKFEVSTVVKSGSNNASLSADGTYILNGLSSEDHEKYDPSNTAPLIESLNISVNVKAQISGYLRVKVLDEWKVTKTYINFDKTSTEIIFKDVASFFAYELEEGWVYDENTQYCYYVNMIEEGFDGNIPFIKNGVSYTSKSNSNYIETCDVTLGVGVQICQANRYQALWGIDSIPSIPATTGEGEV